MKRIIFIFYLVFVGQALSAQVPASFETFSKIQFQNYFQERWKICCQSEDEELGQKEFEFFVLSKYHFYRYEGFLEFARTLKRYDKFMHATKKVIAGNTDYARFFYFSNEQEYSSLLKWFAQEKTRISMKEKFTQAVIHRITSKKNRGVLSFLERPKRFVRYPSKPPSLELHNFGIDFPFDKNIKENIFKKNHKGLSIDLVDLELSVLTQYKLYENDQFRETVQCFEYYDEFVKAFSVTKISDLRFDKLFTQLSNGERPDDLLFKLFNETFRYKLKRRLLGQEPILEDMNPVFAVLILGGVSAGLAVSGVALVLIGAVITVIINDDFDNYDRQYDYY